MIPWAFMLFIITLQAELEKDPFNVPHAETEIVGGYETEYTGRRLAFLKLAKDVQIVLGAAIVVELRRPLRTNFLWPIRLLVYVVVYA